MSEATGLPNETERQKQNGLLLAVRTKRKEWAEKDTMGQRFQVPREGKTGVNTILYAPSQKTEGKLPALFNMHGGGWLGGDAVLMESFCQLMADELPAFVVNVNYTKVDEQPFPYPQDEIADAVRYFIHNADRYGIDPSRIMVGGHSAGAHLACGTAWLLAQEGVSLAAQMLVYPATDLTTEEGTVASLRQMFFSESDLTSPILSPALAGEETLAKVAPAVFVVCGKDTLREEALKYAIRLIRAGVPVKVREWKEAEHGFLEVNREDYPEGDHRKTPQQAVYARECEQYLLRELRALLMK